MHNVFEHAYKNKSFNQKMSNIDNILADKLTEAGKKERYCLENYFNYMNSKQTDYLYSFSSTPEGIPICFDGTLIISNKLSGNILAYYIVEAKVRTKLYDDMMFEVSKFNSLTKEKRYLDKYFKNNFSDNTIGIMYVNFFDLEDNVNPGTLVWDISTLVKNNMMPKQSSLKCNKMTVDVNTKKINKRQYPLTMNIAIKYNWKFIDKEYQLSRIEKAQNEFNLATTEIKKYIVSLF